MPRRATESEAGVAAEILGRAFVHDQVLASFFRDERPQPKRLAQYFELECRLVLKGYGEIWLGDDLLGAAIWRRPGGYPERLRDSLPLVPRYIRLFPREFVRASRAMNKLWAVHPREPHWYLFAVGVVPEATCQGRGSALLAPVLQRCDAERLPAYLEASSADNARLYERLGFEPRDEVEMRDDVRVRPMWREPR
ncbi:MAG TPA: GNAT family N-acetyltransferase [Gaiellaceae bacterium]|nr:GNAT family N-acetyltransferase [Gaiellaceae bacterium]